MAQEAIRLKVGADASAMPSQIQGVLSKQKFSVPVNIDSSSLNKFRQPLGKITGDITQFQSSLEASTARVLAFGASASVLAGVSVAFRNMVQAGLEVQDTMIQINRVFNLTEAGLADFQSKLFDVARNTAQSFTVVSKAALELSRQGLSAEETAMRLNDALTLTRLAGIDSAASVEVLTATINGFKDAALSSTEIVSKLIAVDSAFAVSTNDLANSLSRSSAVAQDAGVSFEQLVAATTSLQQTTARGGSVIGNALKSIFTRIARPDTREELEKIGVATSDAAGNFRGAIPVLQDYAKIYQTLSDAQKSDTSEKIASLYQINALKALIKDLASENSIYTRSLNEASNATDQISSANEKLNTSTQSLLTNTTTSLKQVGAAAYAVSLDEPFRRGLIGVKSFADGVVELLDPKNNSLGATFGKAFAGGIGDFLAGPGLVFLGKTVFKLFSFLTRDVVTAVREISKLSNLSGTQVANQKLIYSGLQQNFAAQQALTSGVLTQIEREQILNQALQRGVQLRKEAAILTGSVAAFVKSGPISASRNVGFKAAGNIPNGETEESVARALGASSSVKAIRSEGTIGGRRFTMNNQEVEIPNFGKNGDSAVIPMYGKGFIPNFADVTVYHGGDHNLTKGTSLLALSRRLKKIKYGGNKFENSADMYDTNSRGLFATQDFSVAKKYAGAGGSVYSTTVDDTKFLNYDEKSKVGMGSSPFYGVTKKGYSSDLKKSGKMGAVFHDAENAESSSRRLPNGQFPNAPVTRNFVLTKGLASLRWAKVFAGGNIPNFANPLSDAINREIKAGIPKEAVRIDQSNRLVGPQNPLGLAVTNSIQEPRGLKDVFASGNIPNYAIDASKIVSGSSEKALGMNKIQSYLDKNTGNLSKNLFKLGGELRNLTRSVGLNKTQFNGLFSAVKAERVQLRADAVSAGPPLPTSEQKARQSTIDANKAKAEATKTALKAERDSRMGRNAYFNPQPSPAYQAQLGSLTQQSAQTRFYQTPTFGRRGPKIVQGEPNVRNYSAKERLANARATGTIGSIRESAEKRRNLTYLQGEKLKRQESKRQELLSQNKESLRKRDVFLNRFESKVSKEGTRAPRQKIVTDSLGRISSQTQKASFTPARIPIKEQFATAFRGDQKLTAEQKAQRDQKRSAVGQKVFFASLGLSMLANSVASSEDPTTARAGKAAGNALSAFTTAAILLPGPVGLSIGAIAALTVGITSFKGSAETATQALKKEYAERQAVQTATLSSVQEYISAQEELNAAIQGGESASLIERKKRILREKDAQLPDAKTRKDLLAASSVSGGTAAYQEKLANEFRSENTSNALNLYLKEPKKNFKEISSIVQSQLAARSENALVRLGEGTPITQGSTAVENIQKAIAGKLKAKEILSRGFEKRFGDIGAGGLFDLGKTYSYFGKEESKAREKGGDRIVDQKAILEVSSKLGIGTDVVSNYLAGAKQDEFGNLYGDTIDELLKIIRTAIDTLDPSVLAAQAKSQLVNQFIGETANFNASVKNALSFFGEKMQENVESLKLGRERVEGLVIAPQKSRLKGLESSGGLGADQGEIISLGLENSLKKLDFNIEGQSLLADLFQKLEPSSSFLSQSEKSPLTNEVNTSVLKGLGLVGLSNSDLGSRSGIEKSISTINQTISSLKGSTESGAAEQSKLLGEVVTKGLNPLLEKVKTASLQAKIDAALIRDSFKQALFDTFSSGPLATGKNGKIERNTLLGLGGPSSRSEGALKNLTGNENILGNLKALFSSFGLKPNERITTGLGDKSRDAFGRTVGKDSVEQSISRYETAAREFLASNKTALDQAEQRSFEGTSTAKDAKLLEAGVAAGKTISLAEKSKEQKSQNLEIRARAKELQAPLQSAYINGTKVSRSDALFEVEQINQKITDLKNQAGVGDLANTDEETKSLRNAKLAEIAQLEEQKRSIRKSFTNTLSDDEATRQASVGITQRNALVNVFENLNESDKAAFTQRAKREIEFNPDGSRKKNADGSNVVFTKRRQLEDLGQDQVARILGSKGSVEQQLGTMNDLTKRLIDAMSMLDPKGTAEKLNQIFSTSVADLVASYGKIEKAMATAPTIANATFSLGSAEISTATTTVVSQNTVVAGGGASLGNKPQTPPTTPPGARNPVTGLG